MTTAQKRRIHVKPRIVGRRTDQGDGPPFHIGQQQVLLGFVESMDFVDEQQAPFPPQVTVACLFEDFPQLSHI
ncbi:MAG: hypothetical protein BWY82_02006 [Verrucomicrobia bacterium ADurb.Bin474]|nr:MAG: hypothetical protein BWY82_02006 [Verrucomicrobia bacterium ADurb.Bin474]